MSLDSSLPIIIVLHQTKTIWKHQIEVFQGGELLEEKSFRAGIKTDPWGYKETSAFIGRYHEKGYAVSQVATVSQATSSLFYRQFQYILQKR